MDAAMYERNRVTLIGNVTEDLVLRETQSGIQVVSFGVGCSEDQFDAELAQLVPVEGTRFVRFVAWRHLAENVAKFVVKGTGVIGVGRLRVNPFKRRDGETELQVELTLRDVGLSVRFGAPQLAERSESVQGQA